MDGWMDGWVDGWMDGWMDEPTGIYPKGWMDAMDGWMDGLYSFLSHSWARLVARPGPSQGPGGVDAKILHNKPSAHS
eukprot:97956-Chlamydomonas_euryale.AAC.1